MAMLNRTGISAATDVLYACLPVAVVWRLQMDFSTKRNLVIVMLFTIVICICAIGKATSVNETDPDFTCEFTCRLGVATSTSDQ